MSLKGIVDRYRDPGNYQHWKDSVMVNILNFGRTTQYYHSANLTYNLPINKIPILNWVNITARYNANYGWDTGMIMPDSVDINLGNIIKNSNTTQLNGQFNMINLYNKVGYLQRVNQRAAQVQRTTTDRAPEPGSGGSGMKEAIYAFKANEAHA
jgi:cell surface protein SprA